MLVLDPELEVGRDGQWEYFSGPSVKYVSPAEPAVFFLFPAPAGRAGATAGRVGKLERQEWAVAGATECLR